VKRRAGNIVHLFGTAACCALIVFCQVCSDTPQLGSEECLGVADALWTAVTAKRSDLLEQSAAKLEKLRAAEKLSDAAFDQLSGVVATARAGDWPAARATLKKFVQGQRPVEHRS
jgi:hypothetical protein